MKAGESGIHAHATRERGGHARESEKGLDKLHATLYVVGVSV
jgi:hypothetical protein